MALETPTAASLMAPGGRRGSQVISIRMRSNIATPDNSEGSRQLPALTGEGCAAKMPAVRPKGRRARSASLTRGNNGAAETAPYYAVRVHTRRTPPSVQVTPRPPRFAVWRGGTVRQQRLQSTKK